MPDAHRAYCRIEVRAMKRGYRCRRWACRRQEFLRDYWQKRPLLIRNAFPGFESPLTPEDLAGLACEEAALARMVAHDRAPRPLAAAQRPVRRRATSPSCPTTTGPCWCRTWTSGTWTCARCSTAFDFLPRWRIDDVMVSFAAPGGSVGAHVDQYDVFLLQAHGHRRWQIDARPDAAARRSATTSS